MRIKEISISNYRGFCGDYKIPIEGAKNLLIYGENGSGKSSLFIALKKYIESSTTNPLQIIGNYIDEKNIHRNGNEAKVSLKFEGDIEFSYDSITSDHNQIFIQEAAKVKSFLSYKNVIRMSLAKEEILDSSNLSHTNELFGKEFFALLIEEILSDIEPPSLGITFSKFWEDYKGIDLVNKNSTAGKNAITNMDRLIGLFNTTFPAWMENVRGKSNLILNTYFSNLSLELERFDFTTIDTISTKTKGERFTRPSLLPIIKQGADTESSYRHKLNEARLSALSLSIYLGAISILPPPPNKFRLLFLDDIFIGLDTSNRLPLLECLNKFSFTDKKLNEETGEMEDFERKPFREMQIILSTYDRFWFQIAKEYLGSTWTSTELYVEDKEIEVDIAGTPTKKHIEIPVIVPSIGNLEKAKAYFKIKDYPACGNYLRKKVEEILNRIFQKPSMQGYRFNSDGIVLRDLADLFVSLNKYFADCQIQFPPSYKTKFVAYKKAILNPSSHDDMESPIYKNELEKAFEFNTELQALQIPVRRMIVHNGQRINQSTLGDYTRVIEAVGNLFLIKQGANITLSKCNFKTISWACASKGENGGESAAEISIELIKNRTYHYLERQDDEPTLDEFYKDIIIDTRSIFELKNGDEEE